MIYLTKTEVKMLRVMAMFFLTLAALTFLLMYVRIKHPSTVLEISIIVVGVLFGLFCALLIRKISRSKILILLFAASLSLYSCISKDTYQNHIYKVKEYSGGICINTFYLHSDFDLRIETSLGGAQRIISEHNTRYYSTNGTLVMNKVK